MRKERRRRLANLKRAAKKHNIRIGQINGSRSKRMQIQEVDIIPGLNENNRYLTVGELHPIQFACLQSLPPANILQARFQKYSSDNEELRIQAKQLRSRSAKLEKKYKRIVSLCTGVEEAKVEGLIDGLFKAVESEDRMIGMNRIRGFLRKVDDLQSISYQ